ncbi:MULTISPECIES: hypothetical protein [unclassified Micromonospora]|uniref:hypothetical protein n=1 Tax=unclassified Micromonospora TaxID=2617518 RepID=UPI00331F9126
MTDPTNAAVRALNPGEGYRYEYVVTHEAWYYAGTVKEISPHPEIIVHKAALAGGCAWEFTIADYSAKIRPGTIRLKMYGESFDALAEIAPFFAALAEDKPDTLDGVRELLDSLGFTDATERIRPARLGTTRLDITGEPVR